MRHGPYSVQRGQVKVQQKDGKYYSFLGSYSKLRRAHTHLAVSPEADNGLMRPGTINSVKARKIQV